MFRAEALLGLDPKAGLDKVKLIVTTGSGERIPPSPSRFFIAQERMMLRRISLGERVKLPAIPPSSEGATDGVSPMVVVREDGRLCIQFQGYCIYFGTEVGFDKDKSDYGLAYNLNRATKGQVESVIFDLRPSSERTESERSIWFNRRSGVLCGPGWVICTQEISPAEITDYHTFETRYKGRQRFFEKIKDAAHIVQDGMIVGSLSGAGTGISLLALLMFGSLLNIVDEQKVINPVLLVYVSSIAVGTISGLVTSVGETVSLIQDYKQNKQTEK